MVEAAMDHARALGLRLQLKLAAPTLDGMVAGLQGGPWRLSYVKPLPDDPDRLRFGNSRNHARIGWAVRKAQREGLRVRDAVDEADLLKLAVYYLLTEPRVHVVARAAYEAVGRRHPLPRPTEAAELHGERPPGFATRLSNGQAAVGLTQLSRLEANLAHRRLIADRYRALLAPHGFRLPEPPTASRPAYVRYPVWVQDRSAAERAMASRAVLGTWFTSVLEEAVDPRYGGYLPGSCPRAEDAARHLVNLPTHPRVDERDAAEIVARLVSAQPQQP